MMPFSTSFKLSACALAASVLISACGGGAESTDKVPPTVAITAAAGPSGTVVFTFTFSEDVGASFTAEDIVVSGGTAGALTQGGDPTTYNFVVTPNGTGAVGVSVAGANFKDKAMNVGVVGGSATFTPASVSGSTATCVGINCIDFAGTGVAFGPFENGGGGTVAITNDPMDTTNKVAKFVKKVGDGEYFGTTITALAGPVVLTSSAKTITMRVMSPAAGTNFLLKLEGGTGGPATTEKDVVTTKAGEWETLSFVMPDVGTYNTVVVFPNARSAVTSEKSFYIDELTFPVGSGVAPCISPACVNFSDAGISFALFENNGGTAEIVSETGNSANKVLKFVKKPSDNDYFGTPINGLGGSVVLTTASKTITMRVFSPAVGTNMLLKLEGGATGGPATTEKDVATTKANEWETLSFVMPDAGTYSTVVLFPNGRSKVASDKTILIDDLKFPSFTSSGSSTSGSGSVVSPLAFSSGYTNPVDKGGYWEGATAEGGLWGYYSGNFAAGTNTFTGGDGTYRYIGNESSVAPTAGYMGVYNLYKAGGLTLSGQASVTVELAADPDYIASGKQSLRVDVIGSENFNNGQVTNCKLVVSGVVKPTSTTLTAYKVPLTTLGQACNQSTITTAANVLSRPIGNVSVTADWPNINNSVTNSGTGKFISAFTLGKITFTP